MTNNTAGWHKLEVAMYQGGGGASEVLKWDVNDGNGMVVIPAFAVDRTEVVLLTLRQLVDAKRSACLLAVCPARAH